MPGHQDGLRLVFLASAAARMSVLPARRQDSVSSQRRAAISAGGRHLAFSGPEVAAAGFIQIPLPGLAEYPSQVMSMTVQAENSTGCNGVVTGATAFLTQPRLRRPSAVLYDFSRHCAP